MLVLASQRLLLSSSALAAVLPGVCSANILTGKEDACILTNRKGSGEIKTFALLCKFANTSTGVGDVGFGKKDACVSPQQNIRIR